MKAQSSRLEWVRHLDVVAAILAFLVRFWFLDQLQASPFFEPLPGGSDRTLYDQAAQRVADGAFVPDGVFEYMPLYPWLLGLVYVIFPPNLYFAGSHLYFAGLAGAAVDAMTTFLIVRLAQSLGARPAFAVIPALLYAFLPTAVIYSVITMPNTLNACLLLSFAGLAARLHHSGSELRWLGTGLLAGFATLGFAGMALIVLVCSVFWAVESFRNARVTLGRLLLFLTAFLLPIIPVTFHNVRAEGGLVLVTAHGGFNFYMGNHEGATGYPVQIGGFRGDAGSLLVDARREAERIEGRKLTAAEFSNHWSERAWTFILQNPGKELKLMLLKVAKLWNSYEYDDLRLAPMLRLTGWAFTSPLWPGFAWLAWMGLAGLILARGCGMLKTITIAGAAGVVLFFVTARYRLTLAPLLAVLGAAGLADLSIRVFNLMEHRRMASRFPGAAAGGVPHPVVAGEDPHQWGVVVAGSVVLLAGILVCLPLGRTADFRPLDHYNTAAFLLGKGRNEEALAQSRRGIELAPTSPELHLTMGNAFFELKRYKEAAGTFQRAIELRPSYAAAHYNLGRTWLHLGRPDLAISEAEIALQHDPGHPQARKLIEEGFLVLGEMEKAGE